MGAWDLAKKAGKWAANEVLEFSPAGTLWSGAKLGYHAFTDPTDTAEQRAEREMHMDDDIANMIPIYGNIKGLSEDAEDAKAYFDRYARGKSESEAPTAEERKLAWYKQTQWQRDDAAAAEEERWAHPGAEEAREEARQREQHKDEENVEYTGEGVPYTPVAPGSDAGL